MSLVGSLEDLGLGDILQIVSLSRKSGVLRLRCDGGEGRIVLADGMVSGAAVKGDFEDTKDLLVKGGHVSEEELEAALSAAGSGAALSDTLATARLMTPEQLEAVSRSGVEAAVIAMFEWRVGDFTFEVRDTVDASEAVFLSCPLSSQYIAMEATRKRDEVAHFGDAPFEEDDGMLFSGEDSPPDPVDGLALGTLERIEAEDETEDAEDPNESTLSLGMLPPISVGSESPVPAERGHLIAIDSDLGALEWLKDAVEEQFDRIHIFQRAEIGVDRIRHYLGRGVVPVVIVARNANADRPGGAAELVSRLRALAPAMQIAVLLDEGRELEAGLDAADGVLFRPASPGSDPENWIHYEDIANTLRDSLAPLTRRRSSAPRTPGVPPAEVSQREPSLVRLKQISERIRDPSSDEDVLKIVLEFATEIFNRVAMFILREDKIDTIAQSGLDRAGGPGENEPAVISFRRDEQPEIFRRVLDRRNALVSSMTGEADQRLALLLGTTAAKQAYLAPIESGGCVAALLYADNLPTRVAIPDTTALEIVLHEAGMALDRELLRRALAASNSPG